jgi:hypothetical protein
MCSSSLPLSARWVSSSTNQAREKTDSTFGSSIINTPPLAAVIYYVALMVFFVAEFKRAAH